jgi:hypothetical protein
LININLQKYVKESFGGKTRKRQTNEKMERLPKKLFRRQKRLTS